MDGRKLKVLLFEFFLLLIGLGTRVNYEYFLSVFPTVFRKD